MELTERDGLRRPFRPYAYKNRSYDYEHEIRIVFRVDGRRKLPGVIVKLDPHQLLEDGEVIVSPYLVEPEADDLKKVIKTLLGEDPKISIDQSSERRSIDQESRARWDRFIANMPRPGPLEDEPELPELLREL